MGRCFLEDPINILRGCGELNNFRWSGDGWFGGGFACPRGWTMVLKLIQIIFEALFVETIGSNRIREVIELKKGIKSAVYTVGHE